MWLFAGESTRCPSTSRGDHFPGARGHPVASSVKASRRGAPAATVLRRMSAASVMSGDTKPGGARGGRRPRGLPADAAGSPAGSLLEETLLRDLSGRLAAADHALVQLLDPLVQLSDLGLGLAGAPLVLVLQALDLFLEVGGGPAAALDAAALVLQLRHVPGELLVLFLEAETPLLFLLLVEPLAVHELGDRREIVVRRHGSSSVVFLDLGKELAELQRQILGV